MTKSAGDQEAEHTRHERGRPGRRAGAGERTARVKVLAVRSHWGWPKRLNARARSALTPQIGRPGAAEPAPDAHQPGVHTLVQHTERGCTATNGRAGSWRRLLGPFRPSTSEQVRRALERLP